MQVLSIVQLVGIVLCITAAAKISHRAQGLGSVASRWHALVTCNANDGSERGANADLSHPVGSLTVNYSESDLESADCIPFPANENLTSSTTYQKRQAFGKLFYTQVLLKYSMLRPNCIETPRAYFLKFVHTSL